MFVLRCGLNFLICCLLTFYCLPSKSHAQSIRSGQSIMDGTSWTNIEFSASQVNLQNGTSLKPVLQISCASKHDASIYFQPGLVETAHDGSVMLRMKLDNSKPQRRKWIQQTDPTIFEYRGDGDWVGMYIEQKFLKDLMNTTNLYIEFQPVQTDYAVTVTFHLQGLQKAFRAHSECR